MLGNEKLLMRLLGSCSRIPGTDKGMGSSWHRYATNVCFRIFQLEASFNEHTKILNQMRCYLDSQIDNSLDPPLYLEAPDGSNQRTLLQ